MNILFCDSIHNYCVDNIPEDEYFDIHTKFYQCSHDKENHHHVLVPCTMCRFNFTAQHESFYTSQKCFCERIPRDTKCLFCVRLKNDLNIRLLKICMRKETFPTKHFSLIDLDEYLKSLPGEGFFLF